MLIMFCSKIKC